MKLARRKLQVLQLLALGYGGPEIAKNLEISLNSVKAHRDHLYRQLNVHSAAHAVSVGYQRGILKIEGQG
jgi:DNA-binding NarL/FixJ family response regulator